MHINCRQFVTKNAPDCTKLRLKFKKKNSFWKYSRTPILVRGKLPPQIPPPARRFAPRLVAIGHSMSVPPLLYE